MSFLSAVKQYLPPSSRSFHAMYKDMIETNRETAAMLQKISDRQQRIEDMQADLYHRIEMADRGINGNLNQKHKEAVAATDDAAGMLDAHVKILMWEACRREGETLEDAKRRVFASIPKPRGEKRLFQAGCARLLRDFDALCEEHGIDYWIHFGTLLGAVRHGGFIPWDDDVDLGMMRADIARLADVVEHDPRYRITTVYDKWVHCKQVRFLYADEAIPCFLDLFFYDYSEKTPDQAFRQYSTLRRNLIDGMDRDESLRFWNDTCYVPSTDGRAQSIEAHFRAVLTRLENSDGFTDDRAQARSIVWGTDNLTAETQGECAHAVQDIFPLVPLEFEGFSCMAPHRYLEVLAGCFGDIYDLPRDINTHYQHVSDEALGQAAEAIRALVASE